jgi:hypothetical protein
LLLLNHRVQTRLKGCPVDLSLLSPGRQLLRKPLSLRPVGRLN